MKALALPLAFVSLAAFAQAKTDYQLNAGSVHFRVPPDWNAIMVKDDGDPQAVIFQVPDATAQGTEDTASVTVKTRSLKASGDFQGFVTDEFERSKGQAGYENDATTKDASSHNYFVMRNETKYHVHDSYSLAGNVAVIVRCQRPLLDATPKDWSDRFDAGCASVIASMK
jgi:hypothetical protein